MRYNLDHHPSRLVKKSEPGYYSSLGGGKFRRYW